MSTDRELLELAAKAAGEKYVWLHRGVWLCWSGEPHKSLDKPWNPLADDGDALRLAVKLGFINPGQWPSPGVEASKDWADGKAVDWYAATRRAIVRAAASMTQGTDGGER